jgi:hypothetical protein
MVTLFIRHSVSDYGKWKQGYDAFESAQKENGVLAESVHSDVQDPNTVVVIHKFEDLGTAQRFVGLDVLKSAMLRNGVTGQPTFWFCEDMA